MHQCGAAGTSSGSTSSANSRQGPQMRQLVELLNSIAGSAASRQSSLPAAGSSRAGACRRTSSTPMLAAEAAPPPPPPPLSPELAARHPALRAAEAALESKLANGGAGCDEDYLRLTALNDQLAHQRRFNAAEARPDLNRYCDVLPYDDNRVRLGCPAFPPGWASRGGGSGGSTSAPAAKGGAGTAPGGARGSSREGSSAAAGSRSGDLEDYVNASPLFSWGVPGGSSARFDDEQWAYIASQGPLKHTRDAFWRMAAEQGCGAVVMLTNTVERGMTKCAPYFAEAPCTAKPLGRFTVQTAEVDELLPDLHRRSLVLKDTQEQPVQPLAQQAQQGQQGQQAGRVRLVHYHYSAWPDHGVPASPEPLLRLCEELRAAGHHASPVLVHCSAGIGRSGVFCVLDIVSRRLLGLAQSADEAAGAAAVDVAALVSHLRRQRLGMVQTREQYVFCHTALLAFVRQLAQQAQQAQQDAEQPQQQD